MRSWIFENSGLKVISLILGVSLWYIVAGERGTEIVLSIPLEFQNVAEGLEVIAESAQQVDVRLRGSSEFLRGLSPQEIQAAVDLTDALPGDNTVYLTPGQVDKPYGVRVMRVTPASVNLTIEPVSQRRVRAVPRVVGKPATGFVLASIDLDPPEIMVSGPISRLANLEQVATEPISAEGLRETYSQSLRVLIDDPFVRLPDGNTVEVTLEVQEERIQRELSPVPISKSPSSAEVTLTPASLTIVIAGPRSVVERLRPEHLQARVNVDGLDPGDHRLAPHIEVRLPDGVDIEIISVVPEEVRARLSKPGDK
jgi:YbbR domain-containing protein